MDKFIEEIKNLSQNSNVSNNKRVAGSVTNEGLKKLFEIASVGVDTFNKNNSFSIKLHKLPADLIPLFFNFQSDCAGFVIKTEKKYIFVMQSEQNKVFIYGLASRDGVSIRQSMTRAVQLFNVEYKEDKNNINFYDNTRKEIQAEEIVLQIIRWGLS